MYQLNSNNKAHNTEKLDQVGIIKLLGDTMKRGEIYSCENFTIFAQSNDIQESDLEYNENSAVVYDSKANTIIIGELGLRFTGQKMYIAEIIEVLRQDDKLNQLWDLNLVEKNNIYLKFLMEDKEAIKACSELINEEYIAKLIERIKYNSEFLEELKNLEENLDPQDPNFAESYLTLETAIGEISEKIKKLQNLLEFGDTEFFIPDF